MNIALVDDSAADRNSLKLYLHVYLKKHRITAELEEFTCAEEYLEAAQHRTFDVVFLDIYMKQKTGMDAARELFAAGSRTKLIFLSSSTDFLRQSYSVRAVYYLVKPIVPEEFRLAMQFLKLRPEYDVPFLEIVHNNVSRTIPTEQILYLEVQNHTTTIYTLEETIHLSVPFRELAEKLEQDERFLRCIRGILVNMQHIRGMGKNVFYLPNDIQVPVNIRHQKQIGDTWRAYLYSHMED
ncbi:MAG: LytTR family DNA-binding domain-containing protein [Ruminococcus callidus]|nr:LytTR family DNA-binding domain-containing protein [Ruminococcus callidus]